MTSKYAKFQTGKVLSILLVLICSSCSTEQAVKPSKEEKPNISTEISAVEKGLLPALKVKGAPLVQYNLVDRMKKYNIPGVSIAVVENGSIKWAKGYGIANSETNSPVTVNTIFQAGSISKPIAALSALQLVDQGKVDLDLNINNYLTGWKVADNEFTKTEKVTLRQLLSHSAGMTVHGFPGYKQSDTFPTVTSVLEGKGNTPAVFVDTVPGTKWRYAGGGYTVMEKLVEDVSGLPLEKYMAKNILPTLGMNNSTYQQPLPKDLHSSASAAYDRQGKIIEGLWHNYPEQAAAGLWTTPTDLAKYCIEIQQLISNNKQSIFSKKTAEIMLTKHKNDWGLGPSMQGENDTLLFRHGGKNAGFTNEMVAFANQGKAVIVMTNADNGGKLIGEILRSVSKVYGWGISDSETIEIINLPIEKLERFVGKYKLNFQVPNIGDYLIDISIKNNQLFVSDPNNGETNVLAATEQLKFIDLEIGDKVEFQVSEELGKSGLLWAGRFQFHKVEENNK